MFKTRPKTWPGHVPPGAVVGAGLLVLLSFGGCTGTEPAKAPSSALSAPVWPTVPKRLELTYISETPSTGAKPALVELLSAELKRSLAALSKEPAPVYALAYQVTDRDEVTISAEDGALLQSKAETARMLDVDVRVGSLQLDQTKQLPQETERGGFRGVELLPIPKLGAVNQEALDPAFGNATRNGVWLATSSAYEAARQRYQLVAQNQERAQGREDRDAVASFTEAQPVVRFEPLVDVNLDRQQWEQRLRQLSRVALRYPRATSSGVTLEVNKEIRTLVSSDGTQTQTAQRRVRLSFAAGAVAKDGLLLGQFDSIEASSVNGLPDVSVLAQRFESVLSDVNRLLDAPLIDPYVGPAILDGRAAGVFFHEVFGHRIEGHRQDADNEGQTFSSRMGQVVMPTFLSVYDDPRIQTLNGIELSGTYSVDDEGVLGTRAQLVEQGVLKDFLMSREPTRAVQRSNGHGRRSAGHQIVPRQANLVVDPATVVSQATLKQALLDEVKKQGLEYGLRFSEISGGYTQTARYDTQAFKVMPVLVYRVYLDGREQLVRGVDIEGTPLTALSKIVLAADDFRVFNGVCGAESGWVPVSATSPSLLVSQIEVARQELTEARPPILPNPKQQVSKGSAP
jgi:TldD protein